MEVIIAILGVLAIIVVALFYSSFAWGFVVSKFYAWFILAMYPEAPHFTVMQFIGIMFFYQHYYQNIMLKKSKKNIVKMNIKI